MDGAPQSGGRSSHEERGLKLLVHLHLLLLLCRSSHEERGLKYRSLEPTQTFLAVAPRMRSVD